MRLYAILCATLLFVGCTKPVPVEKREYVGEWQEKTMYMLITQDDSVSYKRVKGGVTTSVSGPLKEFQGNDLVVGFGPFSTTFRVTQPPRDEQGTWSMVVDGVTLTRTSN